QRLVERHQILARLGRQQFRFFQRLARHPAAVLEAAFAASVLDQDAAHGLGTGSEEVTAVLPVGLCVTAKQAQVGLVDEGGGVQRLSRRFVSQPVGGQPAQVVVDQGQELRRGVRVAGRDGVEKRSEVAHRAISSSAGQQGLFLWRTLSNSPLGQVWT